MARHPQLIRFCRNSQKMVNSAIRMDMRLKAYLDGMKRILLFLALLLPIAMLSQSTLKEGIQEIINESVSGLISIKLDNGSPSGSKVCLPDAQCAIVMDDEKGLLFFEAVYPFASKEEASNAKKSLGDRIEKVLPGGDFIRAETYSADCYDYMKTVLDFNTDKFADKKKRPVIEIRAISKDNIRVEVRIYEPYFKNQYKPVWD